MRAFVALAAAALVVGCRAHAPASVEREIARTPPGQAAVVFFTDFQCPHCRRTHLALHRAAEATNVHPRVVLRHVPLRRHPDAEDAARTAICAERLADEAAFERITAALFTADDLDDSTREAIVVHEGVAPDAYRRCLGAPEIDARLRDDEAAFVDAGGDGVPLLFVGTERLEGSQDKATLERALGAARR